MTHMANFMLRTLDHNPPNPQTAWHSSQLGSAKVREALPVDTAWSACVGEDVGQERSHASSRSPKGATTNKEGALIFAKSN